MSKTRDSQPGVRIPSGGMQVVHRGYTASSKWYCKIKEATLNKHV
jgi:hypothetical protein